MRLGNLKEEESHMRKLALAAALVALSAPAFAQDVKTDFDK